jgi:hypothetical protein
MGKPMHGAATPTEASISPMTFFPDPESSQERATFWRLMIVGT